VPEAAVVLAPDGNGTVSAPVYTWNNDSDTGLYDAAGNNPAMAIGGAKAASWESTGTTNATTYVPFKVWGASAGTGMNLSCRRTTGVSTTAGIYTLQGSMAIVLVYGVQTIGGSAEYADLVFCASGVVSTAIASLAASGSPGARTYSMSGGTLQVSHASGTYRVGARAYDCDA
jgi:hypothetical protein